MTELATSNQITSVNLAGLANQINREHDAVGAALKTGFQHALKAGQLLSVAKGRVLHGEWQSWLQAHCTASERTAQTYMRLAREYPKLDPAKAQRVADLSLRDAMKEVARDVGLIARMPAEVLGEALDTADDADPRNIVTYAKGLERQRHVQRIGQLPESLKPPPMNGRTVRVMRNKAEDQWAVVIGPNQAGIDLKENLAEMENDELYVGWRADMGEMKGKADAMRKEADQLEIKARDERALYVESLRDELAVIHGPAYAFSETRTFEIQDHEAFAPIAASGSTEQATEFFLGGENDNKFLETRRDYAGDVRLCAYGAEKHQPCSNMGAWTGIGLGSGLGHHLEAGTTARATDNGHN